MGSLVQFCQILTNCRGIYSSWLLIFPPLIFLFPLLFTLFPFCSVFSLLILSFLFVLHADMLNFSPLFFYG